MMNVGQTVRIKETGEIGEITSVSPTWTHSVIVRVVGKGSRMYAPDELESKMPREQLIARYKEIRSHYSYMLLNWTLPNPLWMRANRAWELCCNRIAELESVG